MNTLNPPGDILDRLTQTATWASRNDGHLVEHRLDDMTPDHRRRVLQWLRAHAYELYGDRLDQLAHRQRCGQISRIDFAAEVNLIRARHPEEWLDQQPLVQRLQQLVPRRAGVGAGILRRIRGWRA